MIFLTSAYIDWVILNETFGQLFHNSVFWLLVTLIVIDFITGTIKSFILKDVHSGTGINGLLKHTIILLVVIVMSVVIILVGYNEFMYVILLFYVFEYAISITENLDKIGVPFPEKLSKTLRQWKDDNNNKEWRK